MKGSAGEDLRRQIDRYGFVRFDRVMETALYGPHGFYTQGGGAGRRGDFLTSPEVGPLFGAVIACALDHWWGQLGFPEPFTVVEVGAGVGTLAVAVRQARPRCSSVLRYLMVERSERLRIEQQRYLGSDFEPLGRGGEEGRSSGRGGSGGLSGPRFSSWPGLPAEPVDGVILANELLDNLPFQIVERVENGWAEVVYALAGDGHALVEQLVPMDRQEQHQLGRWEKSVPVGGRIPLATGAGSWLRQVLEHLGRGRLVVFDYGASTAELAQRGVHGWLRGYRAHTRGGETLESLGHQDITGDVPFDQLAAVQEPVSNVDQAEWLRRFGLDELVEAGRRTWQERAHIGDLAALLARSRIREAEALCDPAGLGSFRVLEWSRPSPLSDPPKGSPPVDRVPG